MTRWAWAPPFLLYLALACWLTFPLVLNLTTAVPSDPGDPLLTTWILWWNAHAVPYTSAWLNAPAFFPVEGMLAFSEHLLGLAPITSTVQWLGGGPQLAYNLAFLLSFSLSALSAWFLVFELTGRRDAALIGGLLFGFAPYRVSTFPHIQGLSTYWMPVALLGLHRYLRDPRARWLALFGVGWMMQSLSNLYHMLFLSVLLGLWVLWFARPPFVRRAIPSIGIAWLIAAVPVAPLLWHYRGVHTRHGLTRNYGEIKDFGADLTAMLNANDSLSAWGWLRAYPRPEGDHFPGLTIVVLIVCGALILRERAPIAGRAFTRVRRVLAVLAIGTCVVGVSVFVVGPWEARLLGLRLFSVSDALKPMTEALVLLLAWAALSRPMVNAFSSRSALGFYATASFIMWLLSLGPEPKILGHAVMYRGPYSLLMWLPGFDSLRVPARFVMLTTLCFSVLGGMLFHRLVPVSRSRSWALAVLVSIGVMVDTWIREMPLAATPVAWQVDQCLPSGKAWMSLPLGELYQDVAAMYRSIGFERPVVNGYSGFEPAHYTVLRRGLSLRQPELLGALASQGVGAVVVDPANDADGSWSRYLSSNLPPDAVCAGSNPPVYRLPAAVDGPSSSRQRIALPIAAVKSNISPETVASLVDGDLLTRWGSGPRDDPASLEIDLGSVRAIQGIEVALGTFPGDSPEGLVVDVSDAGQEWSEVWRGSLSPLAFDGALRAPREVPLTIEFAEVPGRFVRVRPAGTAPPYHLALSEIRVLGPAAGR